MVVVGIAGVAVAGNDTVAITENGNLTVPFYRTLQSRKQNFFVVYHCQQ
jgi:hypothetical protein